MPGARQPTREKPSRNALPTATEELSLTELGYKRIAGLDEVGRGCLAGPVVAASVLLKPEAYELVGRMVEVRDSKLLSAAVREELSYVIERFADGIGIGMVPHDWIDAYGIVAATRLAMIQAVSMLPCSPDFLLIDYLTLPAFSLPQKGIVYGDSLCVSVAAASIIAKVYRDRLMCQNDTLYPGYGFAHNKGYGTTEHLDALQRQGPCGIHRRSFRPIVTHYSGQTETRDGSKEVTSGERN